VIYRQAFRGCGAVSASMGVRGLDCVPLAARQVIRPVAPLERPAAVSRLDRLRDGALRMPLPIEAMRFTIMFSSALRIFRAAASLVHIASLTLTRVVTAHPLGVRVSPRQCSEMPLPAVEALLALRAKSIRMTGVRKEFSRRLLKSALRTLFGQDRDDLSRTCAADTRLACPPWASIIESNVTVEVTKWLLLTTSGALLHAPL
jgi:hypothetical protein